MPHASRRALLAGLPAALALPGTALAAWPDRPIRIIVTFPPGTQTDILTRLYTAMLAERLGQPVVVDNRGGGQGQIGIRAALAAPPDGYTLVMVGVSTGASAPHMIKGLSYDPVRDLLPVAMIAEAPYLLICDPRLPVRSLAELIAYAKARPGRLNFGYGAPSRQIVGGLMAHMAGLEVTEVSYRGQPEALNDTAQGRLSYTFSDLGDALVWAREGKVRALAVSTAERSPLAPDIPSVAETLPGFNLSVWFMLAGPMGMPPEVVQRLNTEIAAVLADRDLQAKLATQGLSVRRDDPAQLRAYLAAEVENWGRVVKTLGIEPQ
ncbi:tripartite tricarboxylate transporter substrate binding protein [Siccirubricoccus sp. KC 17139]|uniref:Tripartite tricarboxylate transporter substrate binding protein n=1 Tax=Siccirubricoccus soli TaxID=2899147 RepID=A0ABT1D983_9PROT|nr:tripartite tricarboxylate transporter substrate-binding protein [Siccirubricoccus soli]MCO6418473.1 tripartite tricarboxylate transporter substrate binding protein [Siccirubricoccus soli]MCP2684608.1 tripartite tricarboxylate transporter substrate-binding protein [Siccirubricoccus soli]